MCFWVTWLFLQNNDARRVQKREQELLDFRNHTTCEKMNWRDHFIRPKGTEMLLKTNYMEHPESRLRYVAQMRITYF